MGRVMTDEEILAVTPKRYRAGAIERLDNSTNLYKMCDICDRPFLVNNWPDKKPRTPKFKKFIVCLDCDPRFAQDRYMNDGYRIGHPARLRIINIAQVARALAARPCKKAPPETFIPNCKCPECVAGKLFPPF